MMALNRSLLALLLSLWAASTPEKAIAFDPMANLPRLSVSPSTLRSGDEIRVRYEIGMHPNTCTPEFPTLYEILPQADHTEIRINWEESPYQGEPVCGMAFTVYGPMVVLGVLLPGEYRVTHEGKLLGSFVIVPWPESFTVSGNIHVAGDLNAPAESVLVALDGRKALTDKNGRFEIDKVKPGMKRLEFKRNDLFPQVIEFAHKDNVQKRWTMYSRSYEHKLKGQIESRRCPEPDEPQFRCRRTPLPGAKVTVRVPYCDACPEKTLLTDSKGRFSYEGILPDTQRVLGLGYLQQKPFAAEYRVEHSSFETKEGYHSWWGPSGSVSLMLKPKSVRAPSVHADHEGFDIPIDSHGR